jgi:hypothetical protein
MVRTYSVNERVEQDEDVLAEQNRVNKMSTTWTDAVLTVQNLTKYYAEHKVCNNIISS